MTKPTLSGEISSPAMGTLFVSYSPTASQSMPDLARAARRQRHSQPVRKLAAASANTASNIAVVSRPVLVFWREQ